MKIDAETAALLQPWFPELDLTSVSLVFEGPVCFYVKSIVKQGAMTISPFIFYGRDSFDPARLGSVALLAHELVHVRQYRQLGHARFLARYLWALARNGFKYSRDLPLEAEAYALQAEVREALRPRFEP